MTGPHATELSENQPQPTLVDASRVDACGLLSPDSVSAEGEAYLTIGELAKLRDTTVRTLRYYEEMDLIGPVKRTTGKYRLYNQTSLKRLNAIQALQGLNFPLEDILTVLGPYSQSRNYTKEEQIVHTRQSLGQQKQFIEEKLEQLTRLHNDIAQRLIVLDAACRPCLDTQPAEHCQESCSHYDVHQ